MIEAKEEKKTVKSQNSESQKPIRKLLLPEQTIKLAVLVIFLLLLIIVSFWRSYEPSTTPLNGVPTPQATEEYTVYNTLIKELFVTESIERIIIRQETQASITDNSQALEQELEYVTKRIPELTSETIENFSKNNEKGSLFKNQFNLGIPVIILNEEAVNRIFQEGKLWDEFYEKYPNSQGLMTLSRVGFNQNYTQALVYVGNQSHFLAGMGHYFLLVKENKEWKIKNQTMVWIS